MATNPWHPWPDKITCTLDAVMHLSRSAFSGKQLNILHWLLSSNGVPMTRSVKAMHAFNRSLHSTCGIRTIQFDGALGNKFFMNSLADIIAQEMANPRVRPHLHFYPEDAGTVVNEYWHAKHWREDADPTILTPLAVIGSQHFYMLEPCLLKSGIAVMPTRWIIRNGSFYATAWVLRPVSDGVEQGWVVEEYNVIHVSDSELLVSFPNWEASQSTHRLPNAKHLFGTSFCQLGPLVPWTRTNASIGNPWRARAKGARVYCFMMWVYCDDVSGNQSKRWNEHNSILFSPAGLPRVLLQQEYNVHFLCTSNIAPPLEMMDGLVQQLEHAWSEGIWSWDCVHQERVLLIPGMPAFLGDNPMQSEFSCHIGQGGKCLCRICKAKGGERGVVSGNVSPAGESSAGSDVDSERSSGAVGRQKKRPETMQEMVSRVTQFVQPGPPRTREDTLEELTKMIADGTRIGGRTKLRERKTMTGVKDVFLDVFLERLHGSHKDVRTKAAKQVALDAYRATLPENIISPVWRIKVGFDPHRDTPVEILHTVLLGFVKYFWRDAIYNRLGTGPAKKELLKVRLQSFDTAGLEIRRLSGQTLVQYAGSLTGRDFRAIVQAAPFVLYDLVPAPCFDTWIALSNLVPLIWQPQIPNIDTYILRLELAIREFIMRTALWTPRWFNKAKFHTILHLPDHIKRFGPAILFATESFESFNAVIRSKSIHSNHQAPSRDIAVAFAHANCIRHLLSGGQQFVRSESMSTSNPSMFHGLIMDVAHGLRQEDGIWEPVGHGPHSLVGDSSFVSSFLGFPNLNSSFPSEMLDADVFATCKTMMLLNGDVCRAGQWILFYHMSQPERPCLARVSEIVRFLGTSMNTAGKVSPDAILLQRATISTFVDSYRMPSVTIVDEWDLVHISNIICVVNVQHRCLANGCKASGSEHMYQERIAVGHTRAAVEHINPGDLILNTAQMRNAAHVDMFRFRAEPTAVDLDNAVLSGVRNEIDTQKQLARQQRTTAAPSRLQGPSRTSRGGRMQSGVGGSI
ncbi:hypothetical protein BC834DRAFT_964009 [Gloeopeniophorella convolvens]|nr:hypothetical protein BC834DRAFT_964009 [Gloeopeniophorella convolvens]